LELPIGSVTKRGALAPPPSPKKIAFFGLRLHPLRSNPLRGVALRSNPLRGVALRSNPLRGVALRSYGNKLCAALQSKKQALKRTGLLLVVSRNRMLNEDL